MTKRLLLGLIGFLLATSSPAQEVLPKQQSLITKISATWCYNCGTWGWTVFDDLIEKNKDNAVIVNAHHSGDLKTTTGSAFKANLGSVGQPQFFLNNDNTALFSSNSVQKRSEIEATVLNNSQQIPVANTAVYYFLVASNRLSIDVKTKFFQTQTGTYQMATYIVENNVSNYQEGLNAIADHKKVLREEVSGNDFGIDIGNAIEGTEKSHSYFYTIPTGWKASNMEIVTIVWKKEGSKYQFVNATSTPVSGRTNRPDQQETIEEPEEEEETLNTDTAEENIEESETSAPEETEAADSTATNGNTLDFSKYPWLDAIGTADCCDKGAITVYNSGIYQFLFISGQSDCTKNPGSLYFQDGTFYCGDAPGMDCRAAYGLTEQDIDATWSCNNMDMLPDTSTIHTEIAADSTAVEEGISNTEDTTTTENNEPDFSTYPWLKDIVDTTDCCSTSKVIAYTSGIYTFLFIATKDCATTYGQLYFQDGTFYCGDGPARSCRAAYGLMESHATVLWTCEGN